MKLAVQPSTFAAFSKIDKKSQEQGKRVSSIITPALPETAASIAIAATVVGAAATLLVQRNKASKTTEVPMKTCEDCGGSGICSECKGEGFVLKKLSDESAERARITAKNMATRYTAAYVSFGISTPSSFLTSFFPFPN
ncbi:hypothetical protein L484_020593 [Morus notabilis]|uniref:DUF7895 domain-containing protein n=1 Tax=Morus notabilis TaxID=981085 RepID=W9SH27_9ROSA|nr:hypothetical protein L484_020593 [Morus notabilis]